MTRRTLYVTKLIEVLDPASVRLSNITEWMNDLNKEIKGRMRREEKRASAALQVGELPCRKLRDETGVAGSKLCAKLV